jgi:hypothetical protein
VNGFRKVVSPFLDLPKVLNKPLKSDSTASEWNIRFIPTTIATSQ